MSSSNWNILNPINSNNYITDCSLTIFGGFKVFGSKTEISRRMTNLPSHWKIFVKFTFVKIDDWGEFYEENNLIISIDSVDKFQKFTAQDNLYIQNLCGNEKENIYILFLTFILIQVIRIKTKM